MCMKNCFWKNVYVHRELRRLRKRKKLKQQQLIACFWYKFVLNICNTYALHKWAGRTLVVAQMASIRCKAHARIVPYLEEFTFELENWIKRD
ncbi:CLUMA_CG018367, isoform A [Clunio marinus]|uniref:CLUMA_CG018367, isoform A n=1 Tax=Clunio marinus TaxID=568069 RepID=A0A1J1IZE2_9DIPT|nr:CLUMA_CG018367, isoform A [Clunio marinus]